MQLLEETMWLQKREGQTQRSLSATDERSRIAMQKHRTVNKNRRIQRRISENVYYNGTTTANPFLWAAPTLSNFVRAPAAPKLVPRWFWAPYQNLYLRPLDLGPVQKKHILALITNLVPINNLYLRLALLHLNFLIFLKERPVQGTFKLYYLVFPLFIYF